ncbi:uncharacterized protein TNCV_621401 [Trichonephila clavipes]|nr:uncharacterized protein TNCV_621401 [Trichonephila clavipes]
MTIFKSEVAKVVVHKKISLVPRIGVAFWASGLVRTVLNPILGQVFNEGHDESGVLHSARWHDGDWMVDGIRETWLRCFVWMEDFLSVLTWLRA